MATKPTTSISRVGQRRQIVIPQRICEEINLAVGDFVAIEEHAGMVVIRPQKVADRDDALTAREAAIVRRGMEDAKAGNTVDWQRYKRKHAVGRSAR